MSPIGILPVTKLMPKEESSQGIQDSELHVLSTAVVAVVVKGSLNNSSNTARAN